MATLSSRIKKLREERGLKQKDVAAIINVNANTYCRYENGERTPPPDVIAKLADVFNVTSDYLLGRNGKKQKMFQQSQTFFLLMVSYGSLFMVSSGPAIQFMLKKILLVLIYFQKRN